MTLYTQRLIVVMRQGFTSKANTAANLVDIEGGERTFTVPLRVKGDATNTVRAYWCGWSMTPAEVANLRAYFQTQGLLDGEVVVVAKTDQATFQPNLQARAYIFSAREGEWTPREVLDALNLDTLASPQPA